jgi:hypothetical protein
MEDSFAARQQDGDEQGCGQHGGDRHHDRPVVLPWSARFESVLALLHKLDDACTRRWDRDGSASGHGGARVMPKGQPAQGRDSIQMAGRLGILGQLAVDLGEFRTSQLAVESSLES